VQKSWAQWRKSSAKFGPRPTARCKKIQGKADAGATRIYGKAYKQDPEFYAYLRTLEKYKDKPNDNSILLLTTDSDFYQYIKNAAPKDLNGKAAR
jgi:regulator of protease activity HflC (stomatin/prohibitin superfamily)